MKKSPPVKLKIVFLDAATLDLGDLRMDSLQKEGVYSPLALTSADPLPPDASDAEVLISNKYFLGEEQFKKLPGLKLVAVAATGVNNVDLEAARKRGIAVANGVGYSTTTVVEHTVLFLLACAHRLLEHQAAVTSGEWSRGLFYADLRFPYSDLAGKELGIVGYGQIGRGVAKMAKALGMKVLVAKIPGRKYPGSSSRVGLFEMLKRSDFVSLNCPLSPLTQRLIDTSKLALMKPTAFLLNLSRGALVAEADVARALRVGKLAGYATDVTATEPPALDHPLLAADLKGKVLLTPHIAWASRESRQRMVEELAKNIAAFRSGKKRNRVI